MLLEIPQVLPAEQVQTIRQQLLAAEWQDGRATAGHQAVSAKYNLQLPDTSPLAREVGGIIVNALQQNPLFVSAALPLRCCPGPLARRKPPIHRARCVSWSASPPAGRLTA